MPRKYFAVLLLAVCMLYGCADSTPVNGRHGPSVLIEIPQTRQATDYTCGVAVVQSILYHNGVEYRQDVLEKMLGATPERGTTPQSMMACLAEHGIDSAVVEGMTLDQLRGLIDAGHPVICFLQAWNDDPAFDYSDGWEDGHYAVAIGYDRERIYFMDPSTIANYTFIPNRQFLARWHDGDERRQIYNAGIVVANSRPAYEKEAFLPML